MIFLGAWVRFICEIEVDPESILLSWIISGAVRGLNDETPFSIGFFVVLGCEILEAGIVEI